MSSSNLIKHSKTLTNLLLSAHLLTHTRAMGGGPRSFPGGLTKRQWKRLHERRAREKEKALMIQEKQLYHARIRSQVRSGLAGAGEYLAGMPGPMSPNSQIKAMADRFIKDGAEDLWNHHDGPLRAKPPEESPKSKGGSGLNLGSKGLSGARSYCSVTWVRSFSSAKDWRSVHGKKGLGFSGFKRPRKFGKNESSGDEDDENDLDEESLLEEWDVKEMGSSTALRKGDVKVEKRRISVKEYRGDISDQIEVLKHEFSRRRFLEEHATDEIEGDNFLSTKRFDDLKISPLTIKALTLAGYEQMTGVQDAALRVALTGKDAFVKAKAGTGKTFAFLIPAIETVVSAMNSNVVHRVPPIFVLILCPSRELASQITAEANVLLKYHDGIGAQMLTGGVRFKDDIKRLESNPSQIIVACLGRLLDLIESKSGLSARLMSCKMLILDEAGHLISQGFQKEIEKVADCLPRQRQTLVFSPTAEQVVRQMSHLVLEKKHVFVNTIGLGNVETVAQVKQSYLVAPFGLHIELVNHLLRDHISKSPEYKVIIFCPTIVITSFVYLLLHELKMNVREMHSRQLQSYRDTVTEEFRESNRLILVTTDITSIGMNYPDVTLVFQIGRPVSRDHYIHRLGRTGREGKEGEGILLISAFEESFIDNLKDLPIKRRLFRSLYLEEKLKIEATLIKMDLSIREEAYLSWLEYYNSMKETGRDKTTLAEAAAAFGKSIGLRRLPVLSRQTAYDMGLFGVPLIKLEKKKPY